MKLEHDHRITNHWNCIWLLSEEFDFPVEKNFRDLYIRKKNGNPLRLFKRIKGRTLIISIQLGKIEKIIL